MRVVMAIASRKLFLRGDDRVRQSGG